ncbi:hypothetical protein Z043_109654, partial [Scleropages formosus]
VQFASALETLSNAAVDKIIRLVDETKLQLVESALLKAPGEHDENKRGKRGCSLHFQTIGERAGDAELSLPLKKEISHTSPVKEFTGISQHSLKSLMIGKAGHDNSSGNDDLLEGIKTNTQTAASCLDDEGRDVNEGGPQDTLADRTGQQDLNVAGSRQDCEREANDYTEC